MELLQKHNIHGEKGKRVLWSGRQALSLDNGLQCQAPVSPQLGVCILDGATKKDIHGIEDRDIARDFFKTLEGPGTELKIVSQFMHQGPVSEGG